MGVHQPTKKLQMNSTRDTIPTDQPYFSTPHPAEYKNPAERDIITECKLKSEINDPLEIPKQINTCSPICESSTIGSRIRNPKRERRPDRAVYIPRHRRLNLSPSVNGNNVPSSKSNIENDKPIIVSTHPSYRTSLHTEINEAEPIQRSTKPISQLCDIGFIKDNNSTNNNNISNEIKILSSNTNNNSYKCNNSNNISNNSNIFTTPIKRDLKSNENSTPIITDSNNSLTNQNLNNFRIEQKLDYQYPHRLEDIDNFKMQRKGPVMCSQQELNQDDPRIFKPSLECQLINDTTDIKSHSKLKKAYDTEIDDWDTLYDENGDCVAPSLSFSELTITPDKSPPNERQKSENNRHSRTISTEEFPHVLEVSNFPVEFKTQDIMMLFTSYKSSGFDIKWVDDTHALAIFSSSKIAAEVLSLNHPFVSLKALPEATMASRNKARKCAELLQPYRQRPETCVALARRLVTGALGVKLKTSKEELENERRILRNAKEKRILAAKSRDEIWEDC